MFFLKKATWKLSEVSPDPKEISSLKTIKIKDAAPWCFPYDSLSHTKLCISPAIDEKYNIFTKLYFKLKYFFTNKCESKAWKVKEHEPCENGFCKVW